MYVCMMAAVCALPLTSKMWWKMLQTVLSALSVLREAHYRTVEQMCCCNYLLLGVPLSQLRL